MRRERITITLRNDVIKKLDAIIDGQNIRNRSNAIETILLQRLENKGLKKAVILGSIKGIQVEGREIPKLLLPFGKKVLVERNIMTLKKYGISEIIITDFGKWEQQIKERVGDGQKQGVAITYRQCQGTAGIFDVGRDLFDTTFLVANGDILLEKIDLADMYAFHRKNNGLATIAVATSTDPEELGSIFMKGNLILDFKEKAEGSQRQSNLINGGVYLIEPSVCAKVNKKDAMLEHDVFPHLAAEGGLLGYSIGNNWVHLHDEQLYGSYISSRV